MPGEANQRLSQAKPATGLVAGLGALIGRRFSPLQQWPLNGDALWHAVACQLGAMCSGRSMPYLLPRRS